MISRYIKKIGGSVFLNKEETYEKLYSLAEGIAKMFGNSCETLIHEIREDAIIVVAIFNGHVSGRKEGSNLSIYGNSISPKDDNDVIDLSSDHSNHLVVLPGGKLIKASTFHFVGEDYHYALGINLDITLMEQMKQALGSMTAVGEELYTALKKDIGIQIDNVFEDCLKIINKPISRMKVEDRKALVRLLNEYNVFSMQKSVSYVAEKLGVSKYTIYKYINDIEKKF